MLSRGVKSSAQDGRLIFERTSDPTDLARASRDQPTRQASIGREAVEALGVRRSNRALYSAKISRRGSSTHAVMATPISILFWGYLGVAACHVPKCDGYQGRAAHARSAQETQTHATDNRVTCNRVHWSAARGQCAKPQGRKSCPLIRVEASILPKFVN